MRLLKFNETWIDIHAVRAFSKTESAFKETQVFLDGVAEPLFLAIEPDKFANYVEQWNKQA
jgi:hypothetical protein